MSNGKDQVLVCVNEACDSYRAPGTTFKRLKTTYLNEYGEQESGTELNESTVCTECGRPWYLMLREVAYGTELDRAARKTDTFKAQYAGKFVGTSFGVVVASGSVKREVIQAAKAFLKAHELPRALTVYYVTGDREPEVQSMEDNDKNE
jgi:hypothetical protein